MSQERARDLWARYLGGEGLTSEERGELLQALRADASLREEILEDIDLHGLLRSSHPSEVDGRSFAQSISRYLTHEKNADRFVQQTATRLAREGGRSTITRRATPRSRPPLLVLAVAAGALIGLAVILAVSRGGRKEDPARVVSRPPPRVQEPRPAPPAPTPGPPERPPAPPPVKPSPEVPTPVPPPEAPLPKPPPPPDPPRPAPPEARPLEPPPAPRPGTRTVVATVEGAAGDLQRVTPAGPAPARVGDGLLAGDGLRTRGAGSRATLKFPDGTRLDVWAETTLDSVAEAEGQRVVLSRGRVSAQVAPQKAGRSMALVTPHAEARVLGTTLRILIEPGDAGSTRLEVTEGKVSLKRLSDGKAVDVPSGHFAVAAAGIELAPRPLAPARRMRNLNLLDLADNTWARLDVPMPKAEGMRAISWVCATQARLFMVHGGGASTNESYVFDLGSERWTAVESNRPGAPGRPGAGNGIGAAYDSKRNLVWFFGGTTDLQGQDLGLWSFEPGTRKWTRVARPNEPRLECNAMAYDSHNDVLVTAAAGGTWVFSIPKQTWRPGGSDTAAPLREGIEPAYRSMTFDPEFGQVLYFTGPPKGRGELWAFDARLNKWRGFNPRVQPPARMFGGMTYDTRNKVHLVVGGSLGDYAPGVLFNDLWAFDARTGVWTELKAKQQPPLPAHCMMFAYDEEHNVSLLAHPDVGVWAYRYKNVK